MKKTVVCFLLFWIFFISSEPTSGENEENRWWSGKIEVEFQKNWLDKNSILLFLDDLKEEREVFYLYIDFLSDKKINGYLKYRGISNSIDKLFISKIDEIYGRMKGEDYYLKMGKQRFNWGVGSFWNPINTIEPLMFDIKEFKDINEGVLAISGGAQFDKYGLLVAFLPSINKDDPIWGKYFSTIPEREGLAVKVNLLVFNSDLSFSLHKNGFNRVILGSSWSKIVMDYIETHGELTIKKGNDKFYPSHKEGDEWILVRDKQIEDKIYLNFLLGFRYLSPRESTFLIEYYYDDSGYNDEDMGNLLSNLKRFTSLREELKSILIPTQMRQNYLLIYLNNPNVFDVLNIGGTTILSLDDKSGFLRGEVIFTSWQNIKPYFYFIKPFGKSNSEFRLFPFKGNILVGATIYF